MNGHWPKLFFRVQRISHFEGFKNPKFLVELIPAQLWNGSMVKVLMLNCNKVYEGSMKPKS